jgi:heat shock protein HslJ/co-chaperonin GroES (HSP10)
MTTTFKLLYTLLITSLLLSCGNTKDGMSDNTDKTVSEETIIPKTLADFYAKAPDSSWILRIQFEDQVYFEDFNNGITFKGSIEELLVAQGADVLGIMANNNSHVLRISIDIVDCGTDGKRVDFMIRKKDDKNGINYSGCGYYRGSPKLHNVWAIQSVNNESINPEKFPKDLPHFEINLESKRFSGFAGCNQVSSQMKFDYNKITFSSIMSTKMYCAEISDLENEILDILRDNPVIYTVKDANLLLESRKGSLTLKKVD